MDVLLLGVLAVVLIAITVWIVMWPSRAPDTGGTAEEASELTPQGDSFEDQYTSATADLSAGAVATTLAAEALEEADAASLEPSAAASQTAGETWPPQTLVREDQSGSLALRPELAQGSGQTGAKVGIGAAALLTVAGAIGGAWLYSRWQRERNKPVSRIKRRFIR